MKQPRWAFIHPFQLRLQRGIEVYLWGLASALAESGVEVDILTWSGSLNVPAYVSPQVQIRRVPEMRYYQHVGAVLFYVWYLVKGHYDHIFVHFADYGEGVALNLARRITNVPFSVVFHFPPSLVPHRYRAFERWGFQKNAAHLIAVSQATASEVERWSGRSCTVISHGVDTERFKPNAQVRIQVREELGISSAAPVLVSVAALEERKGIQWGIKAMPVLLQEYPDLQYVVIGEGGYRSQLEGLAAKLGLKKSVHFLGAQLDVQPYLCAADMMLVLAKGEASSISLLEAMACGLVSIASARPPFDELLRDDCGVKVDEENIEQVAAAILGLLKDSQGRNEMGKAARQFVIEHHQWSRVAKQYRALIEGKP